MPMSEAPNNARITQLFLQVAEHYSLRDPDRLGCHGITLSECYTLRRVRQSAGLQVTEISTLFGWNKSTASRVVRSLQRKKLVRLAADERHHLARLVTLTAKGRALVTRVEADLARRYARETGRGGHVFAGSSPGACAVGAIQILL